MDAANSPHIVVVGAGFGGLQLIRDLDGAKVRITLIDQRNHHLFQPLLYQWPQPSFPPQKLPGRSAIFFVTGQK